MQSVNAVQNNSQGGNATLPNPATTHTDLIPPFCCVCLNMGHESLDCYEFPNLPEHQKGQICAMQAFRDMQRQNQPSSSSFQPRQPFQ